ncbi:hypothetical protein JW960_20260 [candidate division KSB1 bacterium]|nr:hypothetical protein [candidate division KSB1 bacterium]
MNEDYHSFLQPILQSKDFKDSPVYSNLLTYLTECTLSNNIPKEITIAIDVFGKDSSFNSNKDSTVRYHVHMLRKKLEKYYKEEGKNHATRLIIPKGHYEIVRVTGKKTDQKSFFETPFVKNWEIIVILFLLFSNIFLIFYRFNASRVQKINPQIKSVAPNDKIWAPFFKNNNPVTIILGDDFLMDEYNEEFKRYRQIRDWDIDSESDLALFLSKYPHVNLWKSEITGIPFGGAENLMDILPIVYQFTSDVNLKMSSAVSLEEIRNHNTIYIGEFVNLELLTKIVYRFPIRFQYRPDERVFIISDAGDTLETYLRIEAPYEQKNKYNVDYSFLIKTPGFAGENLMFIVGFGYGGRMERTKMLSNTVARQNLEEEIKKINGSVPEYFILLFEVKSIERTGFTNEIKYFREIPEDFFER